MVKEIVTHSYNEIPLNNKKEQTIDTHKLNGWQVSYAESKSQSQRWFYLHNILEMKKKIIEMEIRLT